MHRLFSMFPDGRPGVALVVLRMALSWFFLSNSLVASAGHGTAWTRPFSMIIAAGLCAGLLTPLLCVACVAIELGTWWFADFASSQIHFCAILDAIALGLLGPGAYSFDGRLFGRRKLQLPAADDDA